MSKPEKYIDLDEIIKEKNAKLYKWMPGFVLRYIKRIVHENDINSVMRRIGHLHGLEFVNAAMADLGAKVVVKGHENLPKTGGCIVAANHPLGGLDGVALMKAVGEVRDDMKFLVNDVLLSVKNFQPLFLPVNKFGTNARQALKMIDDAFASDEVTLVFPAGLVSRKLHDGVADLPWQKSFIAKAITHKKDIIPTYIEGKNSRFFYNLSKWRTKVGIKTNIEMFYLADELFKQKGETITIQFGKPIPYQTFDKSRTQEEWAKHVREKVYEMASQNK